MYRGLQKKNVISFLFKKYKSYDFSAILFNVLAPRGARQFHTFRSPYSEGGGNLYITKGNPQSVKYKPPPKPILIFIFNFCSKGSQVFRQAVASKSVRLGL